MPYYHLPNATQPQPRLEILPKFSEDVSTATNRATLRAQAYTVSPFLTLDTTNEY
jgi:hypothetical protein